MIGLWTTGLMLCLLFNLSRLLLEAAGLISVSVAGRASDGYLVRKAFGTGVSIVSGMAFDAASRYSSGPAKALLACLIVLAGYAGAQAMVNVGMGAYRPGVSMKEWALRFIAVMPGMLLGVILSALVWRSFFRLFGLEGFL